VVANDTSPNRLYRNQRNGKFEEIGLRAGIAFSEDGKARAGMGVDVGAFDGTGTPGIAITNFDNEMAALYRRQGGTRYDDTAAASGVAAMTRNTLGFGCRFLDANLDGALDLLVVNGHIDDTVRNIRREASYAQPPHLFLNDGHGKFRDVAGQLGKAFATPRVGRGLALADFDRDGDTDVLITTNGGAPLLLKNEIGNGNRSIRFRLQGKKSNRDAIGAVVKLIDGGETQWRMVHSGSSYLSQSELAVTFGVGKRDRIARAVIQWPSGRVDEYKNLATGRLYECVEESAPKALDGY
jgi:hypothetical protein